MLALKRNPADRTRPRLESARRGDPAGRIPAQWFGPIECAALLSESDYVTVTLPATPHTRAAPPARKRSPRCAWMPTSSISDAAV